MAFNDQLVVVTCVVLCYCMGNVAVVEVLKVIEVAARMILFGYGCRDTDGLTDRRE